MINNINRHELNDDLQDVTCTSFLRQSNTLYSCLMSDQTLTFNHGNAVKFGLCLMHGSIRLDLISSIQQAILLNAVCVSVQLSVYLVLNFYLQTSPFQDINISL